VRQVRRDPRVLKVVENRMVTGLSQDLLIDTLQTGYTVVNKGTHRRLACLLIHALDCWIRNCHGETRCRQCARSSAKLRAGTQLCLHCKHLLDCHNDSSHGARARAMQQRRQQSKVSQ
jgi:hypothetical protein